jgi:hypothetical protein
MRLVVPASFATALKVAMDALSRSSRTAHPKARKKRTAASLAMAELGILWGTEKSPRYEPIGDDH